MMRLLKIVLLLTAIASSVAQAEPWKGPAANSEFNLGAMIGVGLIGNVAGVAAVGNVAKKIVHQGFVPEINNQVFAEAQLGSVFKTGSDAFIYSAHLRWDFVHDPRFTLFALGGFSGYSVTGVGGDLPIAPRVGIGIFWNLTPVLALRGEISHELISTGLSFAL